MFISIFLTVFLFFLQLRWLIPCYEQKTISNGKSTNFSVHIYENIKHPRDDINTPGVFMSSLGCFSPSSPTGGRSSFLASISKLLYHAESLRVLLSNQKNQKIARVPGKLRILAYARDVMRIRHVT